MRWHRTVGIGALTSATALILVTGPVNADPASDAQGEDSPQSVQMTFDQEQVEVMAKSSGRSVSEQKAHLTAQQDQNNTYADLHAAGHEYDGAFFTEDNSLVLQADKGSPAAEAAQERGLEVRSPEHGESQLLSITDDISAPAASDPGIVSIVPDVQRDVVVITVDGDASATTQDLIDSYGDAVEVTEGEQIIAQATFTGGDKMNLGGGYCSAGFPAESSDGTLYMAWAGHCIQEGATVSNSSGTKIGVGEATEFIAYDGQVDKDMGIVRIDAEDTMNASINDYGSRALDGSQGTWRAPVGTDTCKSGATSGITCGDITGYNASVNYVDQYGKLQAQVVGLGRADICTAPGDSGGAWAAGGYAVGLTSGGPKGQTCGFNAGYKSGSSYFQPIDDVLAEYNLTYAG